MGLSKGDTPTDSEYIARKVLSSRLFEDPDSGASWKRNVVDIGGEVLCVSQFTLYSRVKSAKPDFSHAMPPGDVRILPLVLCASDVVHDLSCYCRAIVLQCTAVLDRCTFGRARIVSRLHRGSGVA